jgi:hypothetical protein
MQPWRISAALAGCPALLLSGRGGFHLRLFILSADNNRHVQGCGYPHRLQAVIDDQYGEDVHENLLNLES